jgi:hypothetical protein
MLNFWDGYKTQILALCLASASFAFSMEWMSQKLYLGLVGLLGGGGLSTLRHGITTDVAAVAAKVERVEMEVAIVPARVADKLA